MATNTNGLIYYKLDAYVHGYNGDVTKNCGLRGEEIDGNFNFLRGNDIKSIEFDNKGTMFLTKYNGEILTARQADTPEYDFNYNPESGSLTIVTPDGKEVVLTGFKVVTNVYHDYSLEGYGSQEFPLGISNQAKTGRYRPAIKLLDTTLEDENGRRLESLPMENNTKHDRYVTKEKISRFGRLFPLHGVEKISERLKNISSEWHVPTKEEWDEILNVIDCANPTHSQKESNIELGEFAGTVLKAVKYWEKTDSGKLLAEDSYKFGIYPVGYCGNRGTKYYGSFGLSSAFWTSTVEDNHKDMYVKTFDFDKETVGQRTWGENYYLSLRLVKKFTGNNFNDAEDIDGFTSNCVHIPGTGLIWTRDNVAFSQEQYDGFAPEEWKKYEADETDDNSYDIRYFINDWNGNGWDKHELKEGEGIVLYEGDNGAMHEWLLVNGELVDMSVILKEEFVEEITEIHNRIDKEIADRNEVDQQLWGAINNEATARQEVDQQLWDAINNETTARLDAESNIWSALNDEVTQRQNTDIQLFEAITNETNRAQEVEGKLWDAINNEATTRQNTDTQLFEAVSNETNRAQEVEGKLWDAINNEATTRQDIDNQIWDSLNNEITNRENAVANVQQQINENKVVAEDNSVIIVEGYTNENNTTPTTIKVNLDNTCNHLKLGVNGIYFDGYFGQF
jgi:uncharacterized protein (TIGR02145 family)